MHLRRLFITLTGATLLATTMAVVPAVATTSPGTASLAELLAADGDTFDENASDYDILDQAIAAVLAAKPDSGVAVLADGSVALTAFLPTDAAFRRFVKDVTGFVPQAEEAVLGALVATVGIDTVETVLLYHVVPGVTVDSAAALQSDDAVLATALPDATVTVQVRSVDKALIQLVDNDPSDDNAILFRNRLDLNAGNLQIGHAIALVLRPADL